MCGEIYWVEVKAILLKLERVIQKRSQIAYRELVTCEFKMFLIEGSSQKVS
jgi:hypothetical protein